MSFSGPALSKLYSQHLNIHAQERLGVDRWGSLEVWDRNADSALTLECVVKESKHLFCSVDAGGQDDPSVHVVRGKKPDGNYLVWCHQWLHRDGYLKRREHVPYAEFANAGELTAELLPNSVRYGPAQYCKMQRASPPVGQ